VPLNIIRTAELVELNLHRGIVVIPTYNSTPMLSKLIEILIETVPDDFGILVIDDNSPKYNELIDEIGVVSKSSTRLINLLKQESNLGFVKNVNTVFRNISGPDVIICNSDVVPARNWYPGLLAAAKSSHLVATATAVTNSGSIATVEFPKSDSRENLNSLGSASETEIKYFPILPTCVGHFVYFNAAALKAVGHFDEIFSPGYGEEVDWSQRAISQGFRHVLAPESVVVHEGNFSFSEKLGIEQIALKNRNDDMVLGRYPYFSNMVETICAKDRSQVESSRLNFKRISKNLSLRIDLTSLRPLELETTLAQLALKLSSKILLLQHFKKIEIIVSDNMNVDEVVLHLRPDAKVIHSHQSYDLPRSDFVFRPLQIRTTSDLVRLNEMGKRQILCQLDFTAYENPYYFENYQQWVKYRSLTELAHELVDGIIYFSEFTKMQSSLLGLLANNDYVVDVVALTLSHPDGSILEDLGLIETDSESYFATARALDQLLKTRFEGSNAELWDAVAEKIAAHIIELVRVPSATTKDALWELLLQNYENETKASNEKSALLELERQAKVAEELHELRLNSSVLYRYRHSKAGYFLIPRGTYRDHVLQILFRPF
jgi:GT2 family glycosyltransferase